jgi:hypothetical protein
MTNVRNDRIELAVSDDCATVVLTNRRTGSRWILDPATVLADGSGRDRLSFGANRKRGSGNIIDAAAPAPVAFAGGCLQELGDRALRVRRRGPAGQLVIDYELVHDGCRVTALAGESTVTSCSLPGAFRPEGVDAPAVALPKNQGIWHRGTGGPFCFQMVREGHGGWSMPFAAAVGPRDALLHIIESEHDARIWFERTDVGQVRLTSLQDPTRGRLRYNRSVLLRFVEPNVTAICQSYRRYVQECGHFVSWEEKIEKRPKLRRLFGALMCFIGYCQDEDLDYAASFRRLKATGFDRAFVYPLSIGNVVRDFLMGGRPPIDIRRHLGLLDELGYLAASWMWVEDVPDDPADLMISADGESMFGWQIEDRKWFRSCPVRQVALANRIQDERMAGNTGEHFDVTASRQLLECHHPDHPLDRRDDAIWRRKVLETGTARGGVISSEGFWGFAAPSYDIGSVKIPVPVHADWYTVPMTSLVYHDSCVHDWWEVDNYNNPHHRTQGGRDKGYFPMGGGFQPLQACQDALAGWPPNVMPFGSQYAFVAGQMPATELYRYTLDSPEVVEALRLALPVAQLHGRIGRMACVRHETLAEDGSVQATTFADGTRVVANYSSEPREVAGVGVAKPVSWQVVA